MVLTTNFTSMRALLFAAVVLTSCADISDPSDVVAFEVDSTWKQIGPVAIGEPLRHREYHELTKKEQRALDSLAAEYRRYGIIMCY
jgi:hypothetical protein